MSKAVAEINMNMLNRTSGEMTSEPSVMDTIHKVYIYNPNYQKWEVMDTDKKWKFRIKVVWTWEEDFIESFNFWLIDVVKVTSWQVTYKDEFGDAIQNNDWSPFKDYFYTNEYPVICKADTVLWFRKAWKSDTVFFKKKDLNQLLRLPKINWAPNSFSEIKNKINWGTYRTSVVNEWHIMYWIFLDGKYKWEYFMFYPKDNLVWFNYSKWAYVKPEEWTLTRVMEDSLKGWNEIRKHNWLSEVKNMPYSLVDLKLSTTIKNVMWKEFNVGKLEFVDYTAKRWDNIEDVNYISEFRQEVFNERFDGFKEPLKVTYIDKFGKEYNKLPWYNSWITLVDCRFNYDFSYKADDLKALSTWDTQKTKEAGVKESNSTEDKISIDEVTF